MSNVIADRRLSPRFALILVASVSDLSGVRRIAARTSDVSRTGCYIDTLTPFAKGTTVSVRLSRGDEKFECLATVMYVSSGVGMGLQFEDSIAIYKLAVLDGWLEQSEKLKL